MAARGWVLPLTLALSLSASCYARRPDPAWSLATFQSRATEGSRDCQMQYEALTSCHGLPRLSGSDARECCAAITAFSEARCLWYAPSPVKGVETS